VVWLDAAEHRWVEEMGGMNLFFVRGSAMKGDGQVGGQPWIVTPPLTGTLLPGITRDSLLKLAPDLGIKAIEERITIDQWQAECAAGELTEVFACGTAAVITPVGRVKGESAEWTISDGNPGAVTMRLRDELIGIQYGHRPDPFNWIHKVC
jgi:branched-chain amino acid aminotransferase